jgi:hypothetical protein
MAMRKKTDNICLRLVGLFLLLLLPPFAQAADWNLDTLLATIARQSAGADGKGSTVRFVETRQIALLDAPLVIRGTLAFAPPDRLERRTADEAAVLEGEKLILTRQGKTHVLALSASPQAAALIGTLRAALSGDKAALAPRFSLTLSSSRAHWQLDLLPADAELSQLLLRMTLTGDAKGISSIEILEASGDKSRIDIAPLATARPAP